MIPFRSQRPHHSLTLAVLLIAALGTATCAGQRDAEEVADIETNEAASSVTQSGVGLALEIENGQGVPISLRSDRVYYINQIDIRASLGAALDEGVSGLAQAGDFASLDWSGNHFEEAGPMQANGNGTFTRRRFYRGAKWMKAGSSFTVTPVDQNSVPVGAPVVLPIGKDDERAASDSFFVRRLRAIQWTRDCPSASSCSGATHFEEEALVELRNALGPKKQFTLPPATRALRVAWSQEPGAGYLVPVTFDDDPAYAYGFSIDVDPVTPPGPAGFYTPGQDVTFQVTLRDGAGNRLHPQGSLPTYNEVIFGPNEAGIQYYRAFFDPTTTYYRRKHRETMLMAQIIGPAQDIQPIRSVIELDAFLGPDDVQTVGTVDRDGVFSQFQIFPPANDLFGGAFDPTHAGWSAPVSDTATFHLPDDAPAGTYLVTVKGRRVYMGESLPYTRTIEIQVGSAVTTQPTLNTGPCNSCHSNGGELSKVLHANDNRAACAGCHVPLGFELEGPIAVRTHFIHSRSNRVGEGAVGRCANCHLDAASIERTSKAACLSCHKSYPSTHQAWFGPVTDMYVGGGAESFQRCTDSCHTTHPESGLP